MTDNQTIYANYRASLRAQRKQDGGRGRTAARKQTALKITADRYSIPMGHVKAIVREEDRKNGIGHEHPVPYKFELAFNEVFAAASLRLGDAPCEYCAIDHSSGLVRPRLRTLLDAGEARMLHILAREGLTASMVTEVPKVEDFIQLCNVCKLQLLGLELKNRTTEEV